MAFDRPVRRAVAAGVAVPDRHQPLPQLPARRVPPPAARRPARSGRRAGRAAGPSEPWWLEPYPDDLDDLVPGPEARYDARESIALSFVAGLQHLPPQQRAVLVLRDVLGFSAAEAAGILGSTQAAVNSALIRARAGLRADRDPHDVPVPKSPAEAAVVDRFVSAFERFDLDELVALLTDDARLTMPPEPAEYRGPQSIAGFLLESHSGQDLKFLPTRANGQPALVLYLPDPCAPIWRACGLIVFTVRGSQVRAITRFGGPGARSPASGFPARCRGAEPLGPRSARPSVTAAPADLYRYTIIIE